MPIIQGYEDRVLPQGAIQAQAHPDDFGAGIGRGLQDFGGAVGDLGNRIFQMHEAQDNTANYTDISRARVDFTAKLKERERTAVPGDETFAQSVMEDVEAWAAKRAEQAKTPSGRKSFQAMAAGLVSEFGQRAVEVQASLAGKAAVNSYGDLRRSAGEAAFQDESQFGAVLAHGQAAIDDPKGMFSKVDQVARDKFKGELEHDVKHATSTGFLRRDPAAFLDAIAPEELERFKPWEGLLQSFTVAGSR